MANDFSGFPKKSGWFKTVLTGFPMGSGGTGQ
jgi:hypothetical protein